MNAWKPPRPTRAEILKTAAQGAALLLLTWAMMLLAVIC